MSGHTFSGSAKVGLNVVDGRQQNNEARWPDPSRALTFLREALTECATLLALAATLAVWAVVVQAGVP